MGVKALLKKDPLKLALSIVKSREEQERRRRAQRRIDLYRDNSEDALREQVHAIAKTKQVRQRLEPFIRLACSQGLFKRIVDEQAGRVYTPPPTRYIKGESDAVAYAALAKECDLNGQLDLTARLVVASNVVWLYPCVTQRNGLILHVITPNHGTVIPDPEDPRKELALIYDREIVRRGKREIVNVFVDDEEIFSFDREGNTVPLATGEMRLEHGYDTLPVVAVHRGKRWAGYYDETSGTDLETGHLAIQFATAAALKILHWQSEKQIHLQGRAGDMPRPFILDGGGAMVTDENTRVTVLDLVNQPTGHMAMSDALASRIANNNGVSIDRLQARAEKSGDDIGLRERRAELVRIFRDVEGRLFEKIKVVTGDHPTEHLSDEAELETVDFPEPSQRANRKEQLDNWEQEIEMGLLSPVDCIMADNPELTRAEAEKQLVRNVEDRAKYIDILTKRNMQTKADVLAPGQSPEANGGNGPLVRDGKMTTDEAADAATGQVDAEKARRAG